MSKTERDDFVNIDDVSGDLVKCYQIQVDESGKAEPVYIGSFKDIPLVTHTTVLYDQNKDMLNIENKKIEGGASSTNEAKRNVYRIHVVTYIMPEDAIDNKIYKIVGMVVQKNKKPESIASLDLRFNTQNGKYEYIYSDHHVESVKVVKTLDKFPGSDKILTNLMEQMFEYPMRNLILS
jgi:hypothetical protein